MAAPEMEPSAAPPSFGARAWRLLLRLGVTAALVGVAARVFDLRTFGETLLAASPGWIALSCGSYLIAAAFMAVRWRRLLAKDAARLPWWRCFRIYLESFLVGLALPSLLGGDAYRAVRVRRAMPSLTGAAVNVVAERAIGALALLAFGSLGLLLHPVAGLPLGERVLVLLASVLGLLLALGVLRLARSALQRVAALEAVRGRLRPLLEQALAYLRPWREGGKLLALSTAAHLFGAASAYFCALAVGIEVGFGYFVLLSPALWLLSLVPSLGGIGPKEGGMVLALLQVGVDEPLALTAAALTLTARLAAAALGALSLILAKADR